MNDKVIEKLNGLLADTTLFYQKMRSYHWVVSGRHFFQLHKAFEDIYTEWEEHIDAIAERILTVGGVPLTTLQEMIATATIKEYEATPSGVSMVHNVAADLGYLIDSMAKIIRTAEEHSDRGTVNLMDGIKDAQEKKLWMLRAWLAEDRKT